MSSVAQRAAKRERGESAASITGPDGAHASSPRTRPLVESVEEVVETQSILLRFPCFDFFRTVHLCELQTSVAAAGDEVGTSSEEASHAADGPSCFRPEAVQFVPGTLATAHPVVVVNAGTAAEMVFVGAWQERVPAGGRTNRAIVHLAERASSAGSLAATAPPAAVAAAATPPETSFSQTVVPSLLTHPEGGVTADEERARRAQAQGGDWGYDSVDVPVAVLLLQRYR